MLATRYFIHPIGGEEADRACAGVADLQGVRNTWYCGSYLHSPWVHEHAFTSGLDVAGWIDQESETYAEAWQRVYRPRPAAVHLAGDSTR